MNETCHPPLPVSAQRLAAGTAPLCGGLLQYLAGHLSGGLPGGMALCKGMLMIAIIGLGLINPAARAAGGNLPAPDTTAPVLSGVAVTRGATTAEIAWTTNEAGGTAWWLIDQNATRTVAQVIAGGPFSGSRAVSASGAQAAFSASGLTAGTAYVAHLVHRDAAGNPATGTATSVAFTTAAAGGALTLNEMHAKAEVHVFDAGMVVGLNWFDVPLSGTGTPGAVVQVGADDLDYAGQYSLPYADLVTIPANGIWSTTWRVTLTPAKLRAKVRLKDNPTVTAQMTATFTVGFKTDWWAQSEGWYAFMLNGVSADSTALAETVTHPGKLIAYGPTFPNGALPTLRTVVVDNSTDVRQVHPQLTAMSNALTSLAVNSNGHPYYHTVCFQAVPGTGQREMFTDGETLNLVSPRTGRDWETYDMIVWNAGHLARVTDPAGAALMYWYASTDASGEKWGEAMIQAMAGKRLDGTVIPPGGTIPGAGLGGSGNDWRMDHSWADLYGSYPRTRWGSSMYVQGILAEKAVALRTSWHAAAQLPIASGIVKPGTTKMDFHDFQFGFWDQKPPSGVYNDGAHPGTQKYLADGASRFAKSIAIRALQIHGVIPATNPILDTSAMGPGGAYFDMWSSAGPITTWRAQNTGTIDADKPQVRGILVNGGYAMTRIVDASGNPAVSGRIRVTKVGGAAFTASDTFAVSWNPGANYPYAITYERWKDMATVLPALGGMEGLPLSLLDTPASVLVNPLGVAAPVFVTANAGPYFQDTALMPAGVTAIRQKLRFRVLSAMTGTGARGLFGMGVSAADTTFFFSGSTFTLAPFVNLKDSAGTILALASAQAITNLLKDVWYEVDFTADHAANRITRRVNGTALADIAYTTTSTGLFQSGNPNRLRILRSFNANVGAGMEVEYGEIYLTIGGVETLYKRIAGTAATVNADPWKLGDNATVPPNP